MLKPGDAAPFFTAPSTGGDVGLDDLLREKGVVLYFFPKAGTAG